jgi:hypothetical protein
VPVIEPLPVGGPSRAPTVHGQSIFEYLSAIEVAISFFINSILRNTMRLVPIIELLPVGGPSRAPTVHGQSIFEYLLAIAVAISFFHKLYILRKKMRLVVNGHPLSSGCPSVAGRWPVSGPSRPRRLDGMMDSGLAEITLIIVAINYLHCNSVKCTNYHLHLNRFQGFVRGKPSLVCIIFPSHDWFAL